MCGIVGALARQDVVPMLLDGLHRLEYRGYDSAGIAVLNKEGMHRVRCEGKVDRLVQEAQKTKLSGMMGIAHTRWATHGAPSEQNAHPHMAGTKHRIAVVHNGIIENYQSLKAQQEKEGVAHESQTDSEVMTCQIASHLSGNQDLREAVCQTVGELEGSFAFAVIDSEDPTCMVAARRDSPLVVGRSKEGLYVASDIQALTEVATEYCVVQNDDVVLLSGDEVKIWRDSKQTSCQWEPLNADDVRSELGGYAHYMQKEIFEQPVAVTHTLEGRIQADRLADNLLGPDTEAILKQTHAVQIAACGTSFHAGLLARHWLERYAGVECQVEVASEFRYRRHARDSNTLFIAISQSGETADTLAALDLASENPAYHATLAVCNVSHSTMARKADLTLLTRAGPEIGVASTKAFITQLTALMLIVIALGRHRKLDSQTEAELIGQLASLPARLERVLELDEAIAVLSQQFADKHHALFLGRGSHYPIAMEGALKLKEISYIHAEAYAAGELKHGPLALVDADMPVVAVAPNNRLLQKLKSNLEEVRARGGRLYVFADKRSGFESDDVMTVFELDAPDIALAPALFTVPLQLLAYHCAKIKKTDIDQPRNLAKAVTVE